LGGMKINFLADILTNAQILPSPHLLLVLLLWRDFVFHKTFFIIMNGMFFFVNIFAG